MRSLVIGDIHNKIKLADKVLKKYESKVDEVIFLGDYFDDFGDSFEIAADVAIWLKQKLNNSKYKFLLGNHDIHYKYPYSYTVRGSGYIGEKAEVINQIIKRKDWDKLIPFYQSQGFLFSHAGFNQKLLPLKGFDFEYFMDIYYNQGILNCPLYDIGYSRGGRKDTGGIFWQDWDIDFKPIQRLNQIVGHTHSKGIQCKNYDGSININVDCFPNYVLLIEDEKIQEIKLT